MTYRDTTFEEERRPSGAVGGLSWHHWGYAFDRQPPDVADCLASRPKPWILVIWEPLLTLAPSPAHCSAYCCYINTVIFYAHPYRHAIKRSYWRDKAGVLRLSRGGFETYDEIETRFIRDDVVTFEGEQFVVGGGRVVWAPGPPGARPEGRRWWMCRVARRQARQAA